MAPRTRIMFANSRCEVGHRCTGGSARQTSCLINAPSSGGRCNTCAQFTRWRFESQCLSGSLIQAQRDMVELRLRKTRQVGASREVLPQEQIGVFIAAALPGTLWIAEVDLHIRGHRKLLVLGHLQSAIPSQRTF